MVDIHCHLLPGLDDGPETMEESVEMAEMAMADGITHIVATPHANDVYEYDDERNRALCRELAGKLDGRLQLSTGCDFHLSFDNLEAAAVSPKRFTINQTNYLLIEFADFALPPFLDETLARLQEAGLKLIITHPERNPLLRTKQERLRGWIESGCYVQVTAHALVGRFGSAAERSALGLLDRNWVHFVSSDAHNILGRPPRLRRTFEFVSARRGPEVAQALFHDNPLAVWNGEPLPWAPEPGPTPAPSALRRFFSSES
ncbi:MAG TPA: CpsB/CapC family capsule biosynthesis tyrosine phosphatase [Candidatus Acidoferrales bacterium]|nr:CpsB/CapC family capsule biosynthesis tyrosine phosphatase [Candidatus Acidoferrales bacterium]